MKKKLLVAAMMLGMAAFANAQTNIQEMYDFNRGHLTTTLETFQADDWGSTFFYTDIYHPTENPWTTPTGYYTEIVRALNFWKNSALAPLSLHVGGELELACNFAGGWQYNPWVANKGFNVAPCAGVKWVF